MRFLKTDEQLKSELILEEQVTLKNDFECNEGLVKKIIVNGVQGVLTGSNPYLPRGNPNCQYYDSNKRECTNMDEANGKQCPKAITTTTYYKIERFGEIRRL